MSHYEEQIENTVSKEIKHEFVDHINHPPHYKNHPSKIECIEITEHLTFCLGNAIKYIFRCDHKGTKIDDLKKAIWYIEREIVRLTKVGEQHENAT